MEERKLSDVSLKSKGSPACAHCHMLVARYAPQVAATSGLYHRECFEAWYFGRHGKRPTLLASAGSHRHRFQVREAAAEAGERAA